MRKFILLFVSSILLVSCGIGKSKEMSKMESEFTVENDAIPPDYGKQNEVLLVVLEERKSYDKWLEKGFSNSYFGNYEFVTKEDLKSSKYSDTEKYRYFFTYEKGTEYSTKYTSQDLGFKGSTTKTYTSNFKRYLVFDRLNDKKYSSGAEFSYFGKAIEVYAKKLEEKRNKN